MDSRWTRGLKGPDKTQRVAEVKTFRIAFSSLREILEKEFKTTKESDYECPSWSHKQADTNGYNRALTNVLHLIKEEK